MTWEFDGVVRLTRVGTAFVIFTIVIGFAAINTGNNSLYIGLAFMLGALLLSGIASQRGLRQLRVEFDSVGDAWAGKAAAGRLRVTNRSRIWNVRDVIITSSELAAPQFIPVIQRRTEIKADTSFLFARRGIVQLKTIDLYTRYPFGFFLKKRRVRINGEIVVFPKLLEGHESRDRFRPIEGEFHSVSRPGAGTEIHSFREYVRGDSLRQVYWKKSASHGRWIIKQTELEAGRAVHIVVDPFKPRGASADDFETMISEAATFLHDALERDLEVILSMPRVSLRGKTPHQARAMFRALALVEPTFEPVVQTIDRNAVVFGVRDSHAA
jgi:uncharacterized protein (DUF58 family)